MPDAPPDLPAGFAPWPRTSPFGDAAGPLLFREDGGQRTFATRIEQRHAHAGGQAHGGMLTTFADIALGYAAAFSTDPPTGLLTVSLSIDFIAPVAVGQLLTATPEVLRIGSRLAHATAVLFADGASVARASATLAVVRRGESSKATAAG